MHTLDELMSMNTKEFAENWNNGSIQDSCLKILGAREMSEDEKNKIEM